MAKPTKPTAPAPALRSNPDTFSANAEGTISYMFTTFPNYTDALATYVDNRANEAEAAAAAAGAAGGFNLEGRAGQYQRVNAGETALEFVDGANLNALVGLSGTGLIARTSEGGAAIVPQNTYPLRAGDNLTGSFTSTVPNDGTRSSGTYTPPLTGGNIKRIVNGGAFTLAAPSPAANQGTTIIVVVTNNASAGAITFSGFDQVVGDLITLTNGHRFVVQITATDLFKLASVVALQ
jgi:hypothetical protein